MRTKYVIVVLHVTVYNTGCFFLCRMGTLKNWVDKFTIYTVVQAALQDWLYKKSQCWLYIDLPNNTSIIDTDL